MTDQTKHSWLARLYHWFRQAVAPSDRTAKQILNELLAERPLTPLERIARQMNPPPPPPGTVDWNLAPDGFHIWRFHEAKNIAVWLNGKHRVEEWGMVWEAVEAPTFGITTDAKVEMTAEQAQARRAFKRSQALEQALPSPAKPGRKARF